MRGGLELSLSGALTMIFPTQCTIEPGWACTRDESFYQPGGQVEFWDVCYLPFAPSPGTAYVTRLTLHDRGATLEDYNPGGYGLNGTSGQSCGTGGNVSATRRQLVEEALNFVLNLTGIIGSGAQVTGNHGSGAHDRRGHADIFSEGYVSCEETASANCYDGNAVDHDGCSSEVCVSPLGIRLGIKLGERYRRQSNSARTGQQRGL